jgi:hypothetical protein
MSQELLLVVIPALIALVGTLLTLYIMSRQQRQQTQQEIRKPFTTDQQAAYKALWDELESVHILLRTDEAALKRYNDALAQVNAFLMKNALYLDDSDKTLANEYLASLKQMTEIVNKYSDSLPQLARGWASTETFAFETVKKFEQEEQVVVKHMEETRRKILDKCRRVLQGA